MFQTGQHNKIVGYLWDIITTCETYALFMGQKCYKMGYICYLLLMGHSVLLMGHNVLLMGYVILHYILYYIWLGNFEGPTIDDARNNCRNIKL